MNDGENVRIYGMEAPTLAPEYPQLSGELGSETITEVWRGRIEHLGDIPDWGTPYESDIEYFNNYSWLVLNDRQIKRGKSGKTFEATLIYGLPPDYTGPAESTVYEEWEYETMEFDAPLSVHKNYKMIWDHHFIVVLGHTPDLSFLLAETPEIDGELVDKEAWMKPDDKLPEGWRIYKPAKKKATSFMTGIAIVTQKLRSRSKNSLIKKIKDDFTITTPDETFGATGQWLRGGSRMQKEGGYWVQVVSYKNSLIVDPDMYGGSGSGAGGGGGNWWET